MGDQTHRSDVTIIADGQELRLPAGEWEAFLNALQQPEAERTFGGMGGQVQSVFRKLTALSPTSTAA